MYLSSLESRNFLVSRNIPPLKFIAIKYPQDTQISSPDVQNTNVTQYLRHSPTLWSLAM